MNYLQLIQSHKESRDFEILTREVQGSPLLIMAPHGGGIEPGTTEISWALAGDSYSFYSFAGLKDRGNQGFHLKSTLFDEPRGVALAKKSRACVSLHGCREKEDLVYLGGLNLTLLAAIGSQLVSRGFKVKEAPESLAARSPQNICNLCRERGVQLEISYGLRLKMFNNVARRPGREVVTGTFQDFVSSTRQALDDYIKMIT